MKKKFNLKNSSKFRVLNHHELQSLKGGKNNSTKSNTSYTNQKKKGNDSSSWPPDM